MLAEIIRPPAPLKRGFSIFLSGSIEMGKADDWQTRVEVALSDLPIIIYNPRRDDWDSSWVQSIDNPLFCEQVIWELEAMEAADLIAVYFDPASTSPVTLLELGLHARGNKQIVCCPDGYFRKGNVDIVCARYGIEKVSSLVRLVARLRSRVAIEALPAVRN